MTGGDGGVGRTFFAGGGVAARGTFLTDFGVGGAGGPSANDLTPTCPFVSVAATFSIISIFGTKTAGLRIVLGVGALSFLSARTGGGEVTLGSLSLT